MIWRDGGCQISDHLTAWVWKSVGAGWCLAIEALEEQNVWQDSGYGSEEAAKAGVIAWMDKTCTQFQNIKAANCQPVDEE